MDSDTKPKPIFSINVGFLRVSTFVIAFFALISGSFGPYRYDVTAWKIPLFSFVISFAFIVVHWFGNSDKWFYRGYRRSTFIVSGFLEVITTFIWTILYAWLYEDSVEVSQRKARNEKNELEYMTRARFVMQMIPLHITMILSLLNAIAFAAMTIGLIRWLFVENKIMERLRLGLEASSNSDGISDRAFSISCSKLRLSTLVAGIGSACVAYFYTCPSSGFDAIFIISVSSCAISFAFLLLGWTGLVEKNCSSPILPNISIALEISLSMMVAVFYGTLYGICVNDLISAGGMYKKEPTNTAVHLILPLIEFSVLVFVTLVYSLIRHSFIERKVTEKMQKLVDSEP